MRWKIIFIFHETFQLSVLPSLFVVLPTSRSFDCEKVSSFLLFIVLERRTRNNINMEQFNYWFSLSFWFTRQSTGLCATSTTLAGYVRSEAIAGAPWIDHLMRRLQKYQCHFFSTFVITYGREHHFYLIVSMQIDKMCG